jgi:nucleotide-binding universal stress UspA family protein
MLTKRSLIGSRVRAFMQEIFLGSVSHNIARNASVSVLLVPALR